MDDGLPVANCEKLRFADIACKLTFIVYVMSLFVSRPEKLLCYLGV